MKFLFDLFPLMLFFAAFKAFDIFVATGVAIAASFAQVGGYWLHKRKFETMHLVTLGTIAVFGGLTLILHDDTFIKWKPTIIYWLMAGILFATQYFGNKTAIERLLGNQVSVPARVWARQNFNWAAFFVVLGFLNIYIAFYYGLEFDAATRQDIWVKAKVFGFTSLTFVFIIVQALLMAPHIKDSDDDQKKEKDAVHD